MSADLHPVDDKQRIVTSTIRKVVVMSGDYRPALELTLTRTGDEELVQVAPLPRNSGKRPPVHLCDLHKAIEHLNSA